MVTIGCLVIICRAYQCIECAKRVLCCFKVSLVYFYYTGCCYFLVCFFVIIDLFFIIFLFPRGVGNVN